MEIDDLVLALAVSKVATLISHVDHADCIELVFECRLPPMPFGSRSALATLKVSKATGRVAEPQIDRLLRQLWQGQIEVSDLRRICKRIA